ncbi:class I SAM-dependent methyltransferase [candidate division WOR-3 bacterium]|nr:class I SAM-dependent methyltransferase [candidate division WOR-3 bacterium]
MSNIGYERTAHLYDLFGLKPNVDFYYHYARESGEAVDVGSGTGLVAIPLAERGIKVFCVEPCASMRKVFLQRVRANPYLKKNLNLLARDAASFDFGRCFDFCFLSFMFDHFLSVDERIDSLSNISRHLNPGGRLVFDVYFGYMKDEALNLSGEVEAGDLVYKRYIGGKVRGKVKEYTIVFETWEKGELRETIQQTSAAGITDWGEVHDALRKTGFVVTREFRDYEFTPYREGGELLVIEAYKKGDK